MTIMTTIDEGLAIFFPAPHSFTGEDVLELQGHGGPVVVDLLLHELLSLVRAWRVQVNFLNAHF